MKTINENFYDSKNLEDESESVMTAIQRMSAILEAKYEAADLDMIVSDCNHLTEN